jgi:membrane protein
MEMKVLVLPQVSFSDCKQAFARWNDHNAGRLGAALAFYTLLSLAPLLLFLVTMVAIVFGQEHAKWWIMQQVHQFVGNQGASAVQNLLQNAQQRSSGSLANLIGLATLLFGASGVFVELRDGLNTVLDLTETNVSGWKGMAKSRLFSFGIVLAIGFILLASLVFSTVLAAIMRYFSQMVSFPLPLLEVINFLVSVYVIAGLFAVIFRYLPKDSIPWQYAWSGGMFTSILFTVGKQLLSIYLGIASVGSAYGAAGSLVAVVVWVYYSAQIFYYGAEVTWVHFEGKGHGLRAAAAKRSVSGITRAANASS